MKNKALLLLSLILLFILIFSGRVDGRIPPEERAALIALYNDTTGDNWSGNNGWKTPPLDTDGFAMPGTEDNWFGITVSGSHVLEIHLDNNQLSGSPPPELGNLPGLEELYLDHNQLTGTIPPQWGNLWKLEILYLCSNQLSGTIPAELGSLPELGELYLYSNQLEGSIPPALGNLSSLEILYLYSNRLTGSIPPALGNLSKLTDLRLNNNQLTGSIPMELGTLSKLRYLFLHSNQLSGSIPQQLGNLSNLVELNLRSNQLGGKIPSTLSFLPDLADNQSDFRWNALYTNDEVLKTFLELKQIYGDWESTQTVSPKGVTARATSNSSIMVSWRPIAYTGESGGYLVSYSITPGPPYDFCCTTTGKTDSQLEVTGLSENLGYYFVVQTRTEPHDNNNNTVDSEYSAEVLEYTSSGTSVRISGRVTTAKEVGIEGVTLTLSNSGGTAVTNVTGDYSYAVPYGWSGTVTPAKIGYTFEPRVSHEFTNITTDQTGVNFIGISSNVPISGRVTIPGKNGIEGLAGVTLTFSLINGEPVEVKTEDDGSYFMEVPPGWSGTVEPSRSGNSFFPTMQTYHNLQSPIAHQNYTASDDLSPVISGRITTLDLNTNTVVGLKEVNLTFLQQNGSSSTRKTNNNGYYRFTADYMWSGTVIPKKEGYHFFPGSNSYKNVKENLSCENYEAFSGEIILTLAASPEVDDTLFLKDYYVRLELTVVKSDEVEVSRYLISRKEGDGNYAVISTIDDISMNVPYIYNDTGLGKDKIYTYIARALNLKGEPIAESDEVSVEWERR